jgi:hypothetical protein
MGLALRFNVGLLRFVLRGKPAAQQGKRHVNCDTTESPIARVVAAAVAGS